MDWDSVDYMVDWVSVDSDMDKGCCWNLDTNINSRPRTGNTKNQKDDQLETNEPLSNSLPNQHMQSLIPISHCYLFIPLLYPKMQQQQKRAAATLSLPFPYPLITSGSSHRPLSHVLVLWLFRVFVLVPCLSVCDVLCLIFFPRRCPLSSVSVVWKRPSSFSWVICLARSCVHTHILSIDVVLSLHVVPILIT